MQKLINFTRYDKLEMDDGSVAITVHTIPAILEDFGSIVRLAGVKGKPDDITELISDLETLKESRRVKNPILINLIKSYVATRDMIRSFTWPEGNVYTVPKQDATLYVDFVEGSLLTKHVSGPFHIVVEGKSSTPKGSKIV